MSLKNVCLLDLEAPEILKPNEQFDYYIFGGILGDFPPKKRTQKELTLFVKNAQARNIGKEQMSTDNAMFTVKEIAEKNKDFSDLAFIEKAEIKINDIETLELPYRHNLVNGKPLMSKK